MTRTTTTGGAGRLATALLLALLAALLASPGAAVTSAAEPSASTAPEASPSTDPTQTADPTPLPTDGEVVVDPTFLTPTPDVAQTPDASPSGIVAGVTGRPQVTPPATDALAVASAPTPGEGVRLLIVVLGAVSLLALSVAQRPAARRR